MDVGGQRHPRPFYLREKPRRLRLKCDVTRTETTFRLSAKRTSPFKSARGGGGGSVQSTTGSRFVPISGSNAEYTKLRGSVKGLATYSISQFPIHFPSRALPCAITFHLGSIHCIGGWIGPRAGLEKCGKYCPHRESKPGPSSP
jgi:hypothetical protein